MMSIERELLKGAVEWMHELKYAWVEERDWGDRDLLYLVADIKRIEELLAQPEQEPVEDRIARWHKLGYEQGRKSLKREPLSDEQIEAAREGNTITVHEFARAIEKAHGIGGGE